MARTAKEKAARRTRHKSGKTAEEAQFQKGVDPGTPSDKIKGALASKKRKDWNGIFAERLEAIDPQSGKSYMLLLAEKYRDLLLEGTEWAFKEFLRHHWPETLNVNMEVQGQVEVKVDAAPERLGTVVELLDRNKSLPSRVA